MIFSIREGLVISSQEIIESKPKATLRLHDDTVINVSVSGGIAPSPIFLVDEIIASGLSKEALDAFLATPNRQKDFARIWEVYNDNIETVKRADEDLEARIVSALATDEYVFRVGGVKSDCIFIDDEITLTFCFFGYGSVKLGTVVDIEIKID